MKSKKAYESPTVLRDEVFQMGPVCTSGDTESFTDNPTPVDWFITDEN